MTLSREELAAYADGELPPQRAAQVAAAVAADPELARQVKAHQDLRTMLAGHYDPIAGEAVPDRLANLLQDPAAREPAPATVAQIGDARARRAARAVPHWRWLAGPALAASLALLLINLPREGAGDAYADRQLATVLDSRLSGDPVPAGEPQVLLSFNREGGELCRAWAGRVDSGIACRDDEGWRIVRKGGAVAAEQGDYRQADSAVGDLMAAAQDMAVAGALDPEQEAQARKNGWR